MRWTRIGGPAALLATLAVGLALSLGLWGHWTASAQDTFIVNSDTGAGDPAPCDDPDFPSVSDIETVIDDTDIADGDTLVLCPGTYSVGAGDAVEVDKRLTIEGLSTADREDVVIQGTAGSQGLLIAADKATIRHMKLAGAGAGLGINIPSGANNNTIQDMEITGWDDGVFMEDAAGNVIETSKIHTNADDGVDSREGVGNIIRNNVITDNTWRGIDVATEDRLLVDGNSLSGNGDAQVLVIGRTLVSIVRNEIEVTSDGIHIVNAPAEALIEIGGSPDMANTFTGPFGDPDYYVELRCEGQSTVDATYNFWGVAGLQRMDIANRIFNDEDDTGVECPAPNDVKGAVVFHPWATGPAPTPTPSPTPTATGTPTATATGTPTPTATPGGTRTIDLSPPGWHDLGWSGADATDPGTALACIAGKYSIAYAWEGPTAGFKRYVEGCAIEGICNMSPLDKYDSVLVNIAAAASCVMPVAP
jgi:parallel beta-helix repeat protein